MKKTLSNYFKVRRRIPSAENRSVGIKWCGSHYAVTFHGENDVIKPDNLPVKDNIGECNSIMSLDVYNDIKIKTEEVNKKYYSETNAAYNSMQTEATAAVVQNSTVIYSMLCTIFRTQNGYLAEDVEGRKLSPVLFNHSWHHSNDSDWDAAHGYAIVKPETNFQTQSDIQEPGVVDFAQSISNEAWNHMVKDILKSIAMPAAVKELCEHLFTTVFMDPDAAYNPSFVVLHPSSGWVDYTPVFDNDVLTQLDATSRNLDGYDSYDENNGFDTPNGMSDWSDIKDYFDTFTSYIDRMLNTFPQMAEVLEELQFTRGSQFWFERDLDHTSLLIIDSENISDLIQTTACNPFLDDEIGDYNEPLSDMLHQAPVIVRDKERSHYGANLSYNKSIEIETNRSYELFLQGKVVPLEFCYLEYYQSQPSGYYAWTYLVPREFQATGSPAEIVAVSLMNAILADAGAVVPIYNIVQTTQNSTTKGSYATPRPTINSYYKTITDISVMVEEAQTSFFKKSN